MDDNISKVECCDVTPFDYEQYELKFEHYISDDRTGRRIKLEEPIVIRCVSPVSNHSPYSYSQNEIIHKMIWEMEHKLKDL